MAISISQSIISNCITLLSNVWLHPLVALSLPLSLSVCLCLSLSLFVSVPRSLPTRIQPTTDNAHFLSLSDFFLLLLLPSTHASFIFPYFFIKAVLTAENIDALLQELGLEDEGERHRLAEELGVCDRTLITIFFFFFERHFFHLFIVQESERFVHAYKDLKTLFQVFICLFAYLFLLFHNPYSISCISYGGSSWSCVPDGPCRFSPADGWVTACDA